jgi:hypothetical protein
MITAARSDAPHFSALLRAAHRSHPRTRSLTPSLTPSTRAVMRRLSVDEGDGHSELNHMRYMLIRRSGPSVRLRQLSKRAEKSE